MEVPSQQEFDELKEMLITLHKDIQELKRRTNKWITTEEVMELTGIKSEQTLKLEREAEGSLLKTKPYGKRGIRYSYNSVVAYNENGGLKKSPRKGYMALVS